MLADVPYAIAWPAHPSNWGYRTAEGAPIFNNPVAWVIHSPEEPADDYPGTPYYFGLPANPAARKPPASTHYFVSYLGFVWQMVEEQYGPYSNALMGKPLPAIFRPGLNLNLQTLSVEVEGYGASIAETINERQWTALVMLVRDRCLHYGIPMDREHILGHYQLASNRTCPGTLDLEELVWRVNEEEDMTPEEVKAIAEKAIADALAGKIVLNLPLEYRAHVAEFGWLPWVKLGDTAGTTGESRRMEAVQIRLAEPSK